MIPGSESGYQNHICVLWDEFKHLEIPVVGVLFKTMYLRSLCGVWDDA